MLSTMHLFFKKLRGFTLLELLVVLAIIGILAAIGIASFGGVQAKARDARRKSDLENIARAMEMYYNDNGNYPTGVGGAIQGVAWGARWAAGTALYMEKLPKDTRSDYYYEAIGVDRKAYRLYARFETAYDTASNYAGNGKVYLDADDNTTENCGGGCNYYVGSANAPTPEATAAPTPESESVAQEPEEEEEEEEDYSNYLHPIPGNCPDTCSHLINHPSQGAYQSCSMEYASWYPNICNDPCLSNQDKNYYGCW